MEAILNKFNSERVRIQKILRDVTLQVENQDYQTALSLIVTELGNNLQKPHEDYICRLSLNVTLELSKSRRDDCITWGRYTITRTSRFGYVDIGNKAALILCKVHLDRREIAAAERLAVILGKNGDEFYEWIVRLIISLMTKATGLDQVIEKCVGRAKSKTDIGKIFSALQSIDDANDDRVINKAVKLSIHFNAKAFSPKDVVDTFCFLMMMSIKSKCPSLLLDCFSQYAKWFLHQTSTVRSRIAEVHTKIADYCEYQIEKTIRSIQDAADPGDLVVATQLCAALSFLYDNDNRGAESCIRVLAYQARCLWATEGVDRAERQITNYLNRRPLKAADNSVMLQRLIIELEIAKIDPSFQCPPMRIRVGYSDCLQAFAEHLMQTSHTVSSLMRPLELSLKMVSNSSYNFTRQYKLFSLSIFLRLIIRVWSMLDAAEEPTSSNIDLVEKFICKVSTQLVTSMNMQSGTGDYPVDITWLSQVLWNISIKAHCNDTPCILFKLAGDLLTLSDETRPTCRIAQLGAIFYANRQPDDYMMSAVREIQFAMTRLEPGSQGKRFLTVFYIRGLQFLTLDTSAAVIQVIRDGDPLTLQIAAALLVDQPDYRELRIRVLRVATGVCNILSSDNSLLKCSLDLMRELLFDADINGVSNILPTVISFLENGDHMQEEDQVITFLMIVAMWNTAIRLEPSVPHKSLAMQLKQMVSSLVSFVPNYRHYLDGKI